jgi:DNA polymerase-3 subunit alpha
MRYALGAIKGVGKPAMLSVEQARATGGEFLDLQDFAERIDARLVNRRCFEALAKAGAFHSVESNRARACAAAAMLSAIATSAEEQRTSNQVSLFGDQPAQKLRLPDAVAWGESDKLDNELTSVGFFLSGHPLDDLLTGVMRKRITLAVEREIIGREKQFLDMIGVVRSRIEKPSKAGGKFAIVTLSDPSGEYELFVNDELLQTARDILDVGERVICRVRVRKVDEELRFSMDGVKKLAQASIGAHETLLVRLSADAPLDHVAKVAKGLQKSPSQNALGEIHIEIPVEGKVVTIILEGRYPGRFRRHVGVQVRAGRRPGAAGGSLTFGGAHGVRRQAVRGGVGAVRSRDREIQLGFSKLFGGAVLPRLTFGRRKPLPMPNFPLVSDISSAGLLAATATSPCRAGGV